METNELTRYGTPERYVGATIESVTASTHPEHGDRLVITFKDRDDYLDIRGPVGDSKLFF